MSVCIRLNLRMDLCGCGFCIIEKLNLQALKLLLDGFNRKKTLLIACKNIILGDDKVKLVKFFKFDTFCGFAISKLEFKKPKAKASQIDFDLNKGKNLCL